jgi:acyl-CoA synthetase (AMP-forming)/AMP-acid ligase II
MSQAAVLAELARQTEAVEGQKLPPNVGTLFDKAAALYGERVLWVPVEGGPTLTYGEFALQVGRCAAALYRLGVRRGTHVAVMLPSIPALAITWLALAKVGAVMLPVNTRYTARELEAMLRGGDAELLVADYALLDMLKPGGLPLPRDRIVLHGGMAPGYAGEWHSLLDDAGGVPALKQPDPDDLMTLQFTSGSTGLPKACMLPHRYWTTVALVRSVQGPMLRRILIDMPFHYMGGQWRFLMTLLMGATAFVARQPSLTGMLDRLLAHGIDFCSVTPALAKQALHPARTGLRLRWAGTMALPADLHEPLEQQLGGAPVREMYGLTETGAALAMPVDVDWMRGSGAAGLPVPFRRLRITDPAGLDVPNGETGELCVAGPGMMQGYYKRHEATAEVFRDGWFRTGDLVRRDRDGFHTVIGRIKDTIRRSGENIAASEVEAVLCAIPKVLEAAAIAVPDDKRGEEVKVCLVLQPGCSKSDLPPDRIVEFCRERLASFKVPRYFAYHANLPKTSSGKVAKQALRNMGTDLRLGSFDVVDGTWR